MDIPKIEIDTIYNNINYYTQHQIYQVLTKISKDYNIPFNDLINKYIQNELLLDDKYRCIAKMKKGNQCQRKKRKNCDFCSFHYKSLPFGTIHQTKENKELLNKYIETWIDEDLGDEYLIDKNNIVYTNNPKSPIIVGKKNILTGELEKMEI